MTTFRLLQLLAAYLCIIGSVNNAQQIINAESDPSAQVPADSFLQDEDDTIKNHPNLVSIKFHLKDESLPEYITKLALYETSCQISNCNFSLIDISNMLLLSQYSSEDLAEAIVRLNISPNDFYNIFLLYDVNAATVEELLQTFGLSFSEIYNNFVKTLTNPSQTIPQVLSILQVDVLDFMNAQAYGNDSVKLRVLFAGNYSHDNIRAVLRAINQTGTDLLKAIPFDIAANRLGNCNPDIFRGFVKNIGITSGNLNDFYRYLNISTIHFLANSRFIQVVTDHYEMLNPQEVLGVLVSESSVLTSSRGQSLRTFQNQNTELVRNYSRYVVELVENPLVQYSVKNVILKTPEYANDNIAIVGIRNELPINRTEIAKVYNSSILSNCTYISRYPFGGVFVENFTRADLNKGEIVLNRTGRTVYNLGSPLFCQDRLYGVAIEDKGNVIKFATFLKRESGITAPSGQNFTEIVTDDNVVTVSGPSSGTYVNCSVILLVVTLIISKISN